MKLRQAMAVWGLLLAGAGGIVPAQAARLPDGTAVFVRLKTDLVSAQATVGARVDMEVSRPVTLQGVVVIPAGTVAWGAVQSVKAGKAMHFDIAGLRLPNQQIVKLRVSAEKTTNPAKDEIKVETHVGGDLGAPKGSEYTAYLDQDVTADVGPEPAAPAPAKPVVTPAPEVVPAEPQPAAPVPAPVGPVAPAPVQPPAPQVVTAPVAPTPAPVVHPAPTAVPGELITVECFSDPTGADIIIDDEYHGNTPSILKIAPGNHQIEFRLMGYQAHSQALNLTPGTGLRTVRMSLNQQ